jgi:hypothetical protein
MICSPHNILFDQIKNNVARVEDRTVLYRVWWGDLRGGDHLEDLRVDGRIILK